MHSKGLLCPCIVVSSQNRKTDYWYLWENLPMRHNQKYHHDTDMTHIYFWNLKSCPLNLSTVHRATCWISRKFKTFHIFQGIHAELCGDLLWKTWKPHRKKILLNSYVRLLLSKDGTKGLRNVAMPVTLSSTFSFSRWQKQAVVPDESQSETYLIPLGKAASRWGQREEVMRP